MIIHVLGTGCPKCQELERRARAAVEELQMTAEVVKVKELKKIMDYGVMLTPALVINERVRVAGRLPSQAEIKQWLQEEA